MPVSVPIERLGRRLRVGFVGGGLDSVIGQALDREQQREDRIDAVVVITAPALHGVVSSAFLKAGFHMLCEKPMTANADQAVALHRDVAVSDLVFAVAHCYTGYPMVREARELVATGALGTIR
jgi:predicted dehydrogenase